MAVGLLLKEDGSLPPIIERVNFWRLGEEELPSFGRSSSALAVHALSLCQRTPTRSPDTHWELLSR